MELQERLEKLEKERWLYLSLGSLAVMSGLLGAVLGAGLMGGGGGGGSSGGAGETLHGQSLVLRGSGEAIVVQDAEGKNRIAVGLNDKGLPTMHFDDQNNKARQIIGLSSSANPQMQLFREDGTLGAELNINESGLPKLTFMDKLQTPRQTIGMETGDEPAIEFLSLNKESQFKATGSKLEYIGASGKPIPTGTLPLPPGVLQRGPNPNKTKTATTP
jgi:hypothetical protein